MTATERALGWVEEINYPKVGFRARTRLLTPFCFRHQYLLDQSAGPHQPACLDVCQAPSLSDPK